MSGPLLQLALNSHVAEQIMFWPSGMAKDCPSHRCACSARAGEQPRTTKVVTIVIALSIGFTLKRNRQSAPM
jgi:hypothetical protein